ncbi:unnamed protein product, partial [Mycena citricolor]
CGSRCLSRTHQRHHHGNLLCAAVRLRLDLRNVHCTPAVFPRQSVPNTTHSEPMVAKSELGKHTECLYSEGSGCLEESRSGRPRESHGICCDEPWRLWRGFPPCRHASAVPEHDC